MWEVDEEEMQNDQALYYFHQGTNYRAYEYMGCNRIAESGKVEYAFRTWAPNADMVYLVGDFTSWNEKIPLQRISKEGTWELIYRPDLNIEGSAYKFLIERGGSCSYKGDPYAKFSKGCADGASIVFTSKWRWNDRNWMKNRKKSIYKDKDLSRPINIYEVHPGSFIRHTGGEYYSYRDLADVLSGYIKYMGYTHVELLPISEYPFDGSWGYQVGAFYAPTSRFGTPDDLRYFVDTMHRCGIGVILDWVPAHFVKDAWGLFEYDGEPLYEYQGWDRIESSTWGTRFFDLGREEVQSFLISNALYYLREFHIDGLRVDAVASMLYLDYDRRPGEWVANQYGGRENLEAIAFLKKLNGAIKGEFDDVLMIAEESGSYSKITHSLESGGLGFDLKWNMGFANDLYKYLGADFENRKKRHAALTFPIMYAYFEKYVLPISHDEVVHGKRSFIDKAFGSYEDKFRTARLAFLMLMTYPGKKLTFMGCEFAQFREWDHSGMLEWFMLDYEKHYSMREYVAALNDFYLKNPPLWELDFSRSGFEWISVDESERCSVAFKRTDSRGEELIVALNFSDSKQNLIITDINTPYLERVFSSEEHFENDSRLSVFENSIMIELMPISGAIYKKNDAKTKISL